MVDHPAHPPHYLIPSEFDTREPDFPDRVFLWATQTQCEIAELIAGSKRTMADSRDLMAKIDEVLAMR